MKKVRIGYSSESLDYVTYWRRHQRPLFIANQESKAVMLVSIQEKQKRIHRNFLWDSLTSILSTQFDGYMGLEVFRLPYTINDVICACDLMREQTSRSLKHVFMKDFS